ncbi:U1 snRNP-associated protein Usp102 [Pseudohyphozyma bogoriensis]|nr:U1 snRNP-associated protein Usp102 [Pseudohyphozyma bogoriensis]
MDVDTQPPADPTPEAGPSSHPPATNGAGAAANGGDATMDDVEEQEPLPEGASQVLYINNLSERIKIDVMKQSLKTLFKNYGKVLDVTAHKSIRMRGQAFVTLDSKEAAAKAVKEVQQFPLYGKPMQLAFARTESDALVKETHPDDFDKHKEERLKRKTAEAAALSGEAPVPTAAAGAGRRIVQMPDEYLPPNKILFVQNLPDDTDKDSLEALFRPYPNLAEVRTIPGRKNIAFVEFLDEQSSGVARDALHNTKFGGENGLKLKVTFAKQ